MKNPNMPPCGFTSRRPPMPAARTGFTLIEILLALAIFAIGFAMIMGAPSGALLMQRRYEQVVEGELASHNVAEVLASRRAFWPMYECLYADGTLINGARSPDSGTKKLDYWAFDVTKSSGAFYNAPFAPAAGGGQLKPLADLGRTLNNGRETKSLDADNQGDFEDYQCSPVSSPDNGIWGSSVFQTVYEPAMYLRLFDTNDDAIRPYNVGGTGSNIYGVAGSGASRGFYFKDPNDRTNFSKGRIHLCHNHLTPAHMYPMEVRSYPMGAPLSQRRVFVNLAYVDKNFNANGRQWQLYAVAQAKNAGDQWVEGAWAMDYAALTGATPCDAPNPLTLGDLSMLNRSTGTSPTPGVNWPMLANCAGLFDKDATGYTLASLPSNNAFNHSFLNTISSANTGPLIGQGQSGGGAVTPLGGSAADAVQYPALMQLPAIIYDWDKNLIQVAYPKEYVPVNGAPDRRLKAGDHFLSVEGGESFTVKSVRNESRPQYAAADQPFFQIVEVSPALSTTALGGPQQTFSSVFQPSYGLSTTPPYVIVVAKAPAPVDAANTLPSNGNTYPYWRLRHIYMAPAATGQAGSSWLWSSVISGDRFMSTNPNQ